MRDLVGSLANISISASRGRSYPNFLAANFGPCGNLSDHIMKDPLLSAAAAFPRVLDDDDLLAFFFVDDVLLT